MGDITKDIGGHRPRIAMIGVVGLLRTLALRAHSAGFRSLRQHPLGEVQALLRLA